MVFLAAFLVYWLTLCSTLYVGDSGELVAAAWTLGLAHPTGYPLYLLGVKAFCELVPLGGVPFEANLFSALCTAAAAELTARTVRRLVDDRWVGVGAGLFLAFLGPIWTQATVARVYGLCALASAAIWYFSVRGFQDRRAGWWWAAFGAIGLGMANHTMIVVHAPICLLLMLVRGAEGRSRAALVLGGALATSPGLGVYGYVPWRAATGPELDWRVRVEDEDGARFRTMQDLADFKAYFLREMHHDRHWAEGAEDHRTIAVHHAKLVWNEFGGTGVLVVLLGLVGLLRRRAWLLGLAAVFAWAANVALLGWHGAWWDIFLYPRYVTVGWVSLAIVFGVGMGLLVELLRGPGGRRRLFVALAFTPALILLAVNGPRADRSDHTLAEDYGRALLDELPEGAQFYSTVDTALFPLMVLQHVEGLRPDVRLVNPLHYDGAVQWQAAPGEPAPRVFTTDAPRPGLFDGAVRVHRGLADELVPPDRVDEALVAFVEPDFASLDLDGLDSFSISTVAQIHANTAEAWFERGELGRMQAALERVAADRAGRPWGAFASAELCLRAGLLDQGRAFIDAAERAADPRDPALAGFRQRFDMLERGLRNLQRAQFLAEDSAPAADVLRHAERAARQASLYRPALEFYAETLIRLGRQREAAQWIAAVARSSSDRQVHVLRRDIETRLRDGG